MLKKGKINKIKKGIIMKAEGFDPCPSCKSNINLSVINRPKPLVHLTVIRCDNDDCKLCPRMELYGCTVDEVRKMWNWMDPWRKDVKSLANNAIQHFLSRDETEVPEGLSLMSYHTLSYKGDKEIVDDIRRIAKEWNIKLVK